MMPRILKIVKTSTLAVALTQMTLEKKNHDLPKRITNIDPLTLLTKENMKSSMP